MVGRGREKDFRTNYYLSRLADPSIGKPGGGFRPPPGSLRENETSLVPCRFNPERPKGNWVFRGGRPILQPNKGNRRNQPHPGNLERRQHQFPGGKKHVIECVQKKKFILRDHQSILNPEETSGGGMGKTFSSQENGKKSPLTEKSEESKMASRLNSKEPRNRRGRSELRCAETGKRRISLSGNGGKPTR